MTNASNKEADQVTLDELDAILDKNLADVEDLPEYLDRVSNGFYKLRILTVEQKRVEIPKEEGSSEKIDAPVIQFVFEIQETLELEDAEAPEPKAGDRFNVAIFLHKEPEKALGVLKAMFADVAASLNVANVKELIKNNLKGLDVMAKVSTKKDRKKEDKYYIRVSNCKLI